MHKGLDPKGFEQKYTTPSHSSALATQFLTHMENSVLEQETGKQLNCGQLRKQPRLQETRNTSFSNEMGRFFQGVGKGPMVRVRELKEKSHSLQ